ncbi:ATP-dependent helicase [Kribbella sp. NPDC051137]|uniref:ATP-dependent helicase n=1 Tax=Kribbella sp. NPDC051137 TaxID=3155045 RepID=UPI003442DF66
MPVDEGQRAAATTENANLLVIAPPGCGKTELLAMRADALIPRLQAHQKVLALTFTNRSKANLSNRLRTVLGEARYRRYVSVRNFHGHAAEIVLSHGRTIGLDPDRLAMPTTKTFGKAIAALSDDKDDRDEAAQLLADIKRGARHDPEVLDLIRRSGNRLAELVELARSAGDQLHYDDLLRHAQCLLRVDEVARLYQQHYGAVLVDEFQDLSLQQLDIALRTANTTRTFAGDPLQGIFSWAGAAPREVELQLRDLADEPIHLNVSYRSSPAVLAMVNRIAQPMGAVALRAYDPPAWPDGGAAAAFTFSAPEIEAQRVANFAARVLAVAPELSIGIVSRASWRRKEIDTQLAVLDVPRRHWDLDIEDPAIYERIRVTVEASRRGATVDDAREAAIAATSPDDVDTLEQLNDAFDQLEAVGAPTARKALAQFRPAADDAAVGPGVHLLNAHTGKGQQFDWVVVVGLEEGHLPDKRCVEDPAKLTEEQRALLVMLSRARHGVIATRVARQNGWYGPYAVQQSRWWDDLAAAATMTSAQLSAHLQRMYPK